MGFCLILQTFADDYELPTEFLGHSQMILLNNEVMSQE